MNCSNCGKPANHVENRCFHMDDGRVLCVPCKTKEDRAKEQAAWDKAFGKEKKS